MSVFGLGDLAFLGAAGGSYDPDAAAYFARVEGASGDNDTLEGAVKDAINAFIVGCKADGIWNAIKASCILAGARTLNGALQPLVGTAPTSFNFLSGDYNRKTGLVGDGSTKYLNSGYFYASGLQDNKHLALWTSTVQTTSGPIAYAGSSIVANARTQIIVLNESLNKISTRCSDETTTTSTSDVNVIGFHGVSRSSSASYAGRSAGANRTITSASVSGAENDMFIFARNNSSTTLWTTARLAFYSIGESLNLALLDARVTTLMNAFDSAIPS